MYHQGFRILYVNGMISGHDSTPGASNLNDFGAFLGLIFTWQWYFRELTCWQFKQPVQLIYDYAHLELKSCSVAERLKMLLASISKVPFLCLTVKSHNALIKGSTDILCCTLISSTFTMHCRYSLTFQHTTDTVPLPDISVKFRENSTTTLWT